MITSGENEPQSLLGQRDWDAAKFLRNRAWLVLSIGLFLLPILLLGASRSLKVYKSDYYQWLPSGFAEAVTYKDFVRRFGVDEMVVISWEGATLDDPRVAYLQQALEKETLDGSPMFLRVTSGPEFLNQVLSTGVSYETAMSRITGLVVGMDRKTTCVIAYPNESPGQIQGQFSVDRVNIMRRIYEIAAAEPLEIPPEELRLGGPTIDGAVLELETQKSLDQFLWLTVVMVFLVAWVRMRDFLMTVIAVTFSLLCAVVSLAILYFGGGQMNMTMIMLPTLSFILGISGCVHMINYYRKAIATGAGCDAAAVALKNGLRPVMLSSFTTAIGMFSLGVSQVAPIRSFGFFAGMGIISSLIVILLFLPATLYFLRNGFGARLIGKQSHRRERISGVSRKTSTVINWVCREHGLVVIPLLIALSILSVGVFKLKGSVKLQNRFASRVKILQDYEWLENHLGPLVPMEIILQFTPESHLSNWQKMQVVRAVERSVRKTTAVNASLSVATFEPAMPSGDGIRGRVARRARLDRWNSELENFADAKLVKFYPDSSAWRISLRIAAMNDIDYGSLIDSLQENVEYQLDFLNQSGLEATITGAIPLIYKAQRQILNDLMYSFLTAFVFISLVMIVVLRGIAAGLVSMIPNVFPPLFVFGTMGWIGQKIEMGSVLTASVALGIAVDDTVHFLTWYRRSIGAGSSRYKAIRTAFDHCAKAMIDTSLICCFGVAPFLLSVFMPTFNFAMLLIVMLLAAIVGDLILLPALLAGPLGILLQRGVRKESLHPQIDEISIIEPTESKSIETSSTNGNPKAPHLPSSAEKGMSSSSQQRNQ